MTHYDTSYKGLSREQADPKALDDIREYMGAEKFERLTELFRETNASDIVTYERFVFFCGFAGVQGYPVAAWYRHCFPERADSVPEGTVDL